MAMELAMTGEITEGQKGTVTMELDIDMEVTQDPEAAHINGNIGMSVLGTNMSVDMENYTVAEGDDYVSYTLVNGLWSKEHTEGNSAVLRSQHLRILHQMRMLLKFPRSLFR